MKLNSVLVRSILIKSILTISNKIRRFRPFFNFTHKWTLKYFIPKPDYFDHNAAISVQHYILLLIHVYKDTFMYELHVLILNSIAETFHFLIYKFLNFLSLPLCSSDVKLWSVYLVGEKFLYKLEF